MNLSKSWMKQGMRNTRVGELFAFAETVGGLINSPVELTEIGFSISAIRLYHAWAVCIKN